MKPGVRTLGIDDGPFSRSQRGNVLVVGTVFRGGTLLDGLLTTRIRKDGRNSTRKLEEMILRSRFYPQLHYVMLDGIALGGFNVVDIDRLHRSTGLPVVVVMRKMPDLDAITRALTKVAGGDRKLKLIRRAGPIHQVAGLCCQLRGIEPEEARQLIRLTATRSRLPEPLRAAHFIARAIVMGESCRGA